MSVRSGSNWNLKMLVFVEGGKPEYPEKNPRSRDENQQQTQPTDDAESGNRTRATLGGGECSHHCAIPTPPNMLQLLQICYKYVTTVSTLIIRRELQGCLLIPTPPGTIKPFYGNVLSSSSHYAKITTLFK